MSNQCPFDGLCYRLCFSTLKRNCHVDAAVLGSFVSILHEQQVNHPTAPHVSYACSIIWCRFKLPKTWYYFNPMSNRINFVSPFQCVAISVITQLTLLWVWACQSYLPISSRDQRSEKVVFYFRHEVWVEIVQSLYPYYLSCKHNYFHTQPRGFNDFATPYETWDTSTPYVRP